MYATPRSSWSLADSPSLVLSRSFASASVICGSAISGPPTSSSPFNSWLRSTPPSVLDRGGATFTWPCLAD